MDAFKASFWGVVANVAQAAQQADIEEKLQHTVERVRQSAESAIDNIKEEAKNFNKEEAMKRLSANAKKFATETVPQTAKQTKQWAADHPGAATGVAVGTAALIVPALIVGPSLAVVGFGADGVVGGSIAAGAQSGIGNVAAGSLFATLQSAGAGGYGLAAVNGVVQGAGAIGAIASCCSSKFKSKKGENKEDEKDEGKDDKGEGKDDKDEDRGEKEGKDENGGEDENGEGRDEKGHDGNGDGDTTKPRL